MTKITELVNKLKHLDSKSRYAGDRAGLSDLEPAAAVIHDMLKMWYTFSAAARLDAWHARPRPVYYVTGLNAQGCSSRT